MGNRLAPEIFRYLILDAGYSEKSDIFDFGHVIRGMVYGNNPITTSVEWPVPPPLDVIVKACTHHLPPNRTSLEELQSLVDNIVVADP